MCSHHLSYILFYEILILKRRQFLKKKQNFLDLSSSRIFYKNKYKVTQVKKCRILIIIVHMKIYNNIYKIII